MKNTKNYARLFLTFMLSFSLSLGAGCSDDEGGGDFPWFLLLSSEKEITAFSVSITLLTPDRSVKFIGSINSTDITVIVPAGTNLAALIATFATNGKSVTVGGTVQESGTTFNNFTNDVTYTVTAGNDTAQDYTVSVVDSGIVWSGNYEIDDIDSANNLTVLSGFIGVRGGLTIENSDLINLTGLEKLAFVRDFMIIQNNDDLTNLDGLTNLTSVGDYMNIGDNIVLTNIDGLSNLTSVMGNLNIWGNVALTNLDGLSNLTSVGGGMSIMSNDSLTNLNGLSNLTSIGGGMSITSNDSLKNLNGLINLCSVVGNFTISNNTGLCNTFAEDLRDQVQACDGGGIGGATINITNNNGTCP